ncbi:MAG: GNAT family N-acetyltransferase [Ancalomicrobiaceae bacterium]|nr:GNAT family N-acetyltransferase [Ancalomicrobiaceae bacterium]
MIAVRPAGPGDQVALADLLVRADSAEGGKADAAAATEMLASLPPGIEFLLAVDQAGSLVGLAAFSLVGPSIGSGLSMMLYLKDLYVVPAQRRRGIARRLIAGLARIASARGATRIGWTAPRDRPAALALYDGLGAARVDLVSYRLGGAALARLAENQG